MNGLKRCVIYTQYYSIIKKKKKKDAILLSVTICLDLEGIRLSEISIIDEER